MVCIDHMSSAFFCGIPCSPSNGWEVHQCSPAAVLRRPDGDSDFFVEVHDLKFFADFYNEHHKCCWPRVVLDAHLSKSAEEVARGQLKYPPSNEVTHSGSAAAAVLDREGRTSLSLHVNHAAQVMEQLRRTQTQKLPRAAYARRALFHQGVPPVLRCQEQSDASVYVMSGRLQLFHTCNNGASPIPQQHNVFQGICTHGDTSNDLARDVFPLVLVMAPDDDCAAYLDSDPPSASEATQWRTRPLVMALESVEPVSYADEHATQSEIEVWCAAYTPFTWVCNPLGNERTSLLVKSSGAMRRKPRRQQHRGSSISAPSTQFANEKASRAPREEVAATLKPLRLSFMIYASRYTSEDAKYRVVQSLVSSYVYNLHVTKSMRFGLGGPELYKRVMLGVNEEALLHAQGRRPTQLMRLLDESLDGVVLQPSATTESTENQNTVPEGEVAREAEELPPLKVHRQESGGEAPPVTPTPHCQPSCSVSAVTTYPVAQICTKRPLEREWCRLPNSTTLASVLPPSPSKSEPQRSCWSLRVQREASDSTTSPVVLSSLATLQDLATALRSVFS